MRLNSGIEVFTRSSPVAHRSRRGCSSGSSGDGNGSRLSQYGRWRSAGSAASRLCRCVVPVRGSPQMMIGRSIATSLDLGMRGCQRLQPKSVDQVAHQLFEDHGGPGVGQAGLVAQRGAQHLEAFPERRVAPVVEAGALGGRREHRVGVELEHGAVAGQRLPHRLRRVRIHRVGQVGQPDGGRASGHRASSSTSTTRHRGRAGVSSGRNHRSQISPFDRPAVDTQFGCPGSVSLMTIRQEPSGS